MKRKSMNEYDCFGSTFPLRPVFEKVVSLGWYDGTTSGLAQRSLCQTSVEERAQNGVLRGPVPGSSGDAPRTLCAFRYDIVDWDADQDRRIFVLSPIAVREFERVVDSFGESDSPTWPLWSPKLWQLPSPAKERATVELDRCLARAKCPEYLVASDRRLETLFAAKRITTSARDRLPPVFDGLPVSNDFDYWAECVGLRT